METTMSMPISETAVRIYIKNDALFEKIKEDNEDISCATGSMIFFHVELLNMSHPSPELEEVMNAVAYLDDYDYLIIDG